MKHDSDCTPHFLIPPTIFAAETRSTRKILLEILYSFRTKCSCSHIISAVCEPGKGTTLSTALHYSNSSESQWPVTLRKEALFVEAVQLSVVKERLLISSSDI